MTVTDIILLVCFLPAVFQGLSKGLVGQVFSLLAIIAGGYLAIHFAPDAAEWASGIWKDADPTALRLASFAVLLTAGILVTGLVGKLLTKLVKFATLGWINRLLGLVFSIFKTALLLGLAIYFFDSLNLKWGLVDQNTLNSAPVYVYLRDFSFKIFPSLKGLISSGLING